MDALCSHAHESGRSLQLPQDVDVSLSLSSVAGTAASSMPGRGDIPVDASIFLSSMNASSAEILPKATSTQASSIFPPFAMPIDMSPQHANARVPSTLLSPEVTPLSENSSRSGPFVSSNSVRTPRPPPLSTDTRYVPFGKQALDNSPRFNLQHDVFQSTSTSVEPRTRAYTTNGLSATILDKTTAAADAPASIENLSDPHALQPLKPLAPFLGSRTTRQSRLSAQLCAPVEASGIISPHPTVSDFASLEIHNVVPLKMPCALPQVNLEHLTALSECSPVHNPSSVAMAKQQYPHQFTQEVGDREWQDNVQGLGEDAGTARKRVRQGSPTSISGLNLIRLDEAPDLKHLTLSVPIAQSSLDPGQSTYDAEYSQDDCGRQLMSQIGIEGRSCDIIERSEYGTSQANVRVMGTRIGMHSTETYNYGAQPPSAISSSLDGTSFSFTGLPSLDHFASRPGRAPSRQDTPSIVSTQGLQGPAQVESPLLLPIPRMQLSSSITFAPVSSAHFGDSRASFGTRPFGDMDHDRCGITPTPHSANPFIDNAAARADTMAKTSIGSLYTRISGDIMNRGLCMQGPDSVPPRYPTIMPSRSTAVSQFGSMPLKGGTGSTSLEVTMSHVPTQDVPVRYEAIDSFKLTSICEFPGSNKRVAAVSADHALPPTADCWESSRRQGQVSMSIAETRYPRASMQSSIERWESEQKSSEPFATDASDHYNWQQKSSHLTQPVDGFGYGMERYRSQIYPTAVDSMGNALDASVLHPAQNTYTISGNGFVVDSASQLRNSNETIGEKDIISEISGDEFHANEDNGCEQEFTKDTFGFGASVSDDAESSGWMPHAVKPAMSHNLILSQEEQPTAQEFLESSSSVTSNFHPYPDHGRTADFQDIRSPSGSIASANSRITNASAHSRNSSATSSTALSQSTTHTGTSSRTRRGLSTTSHLGVLDPSVAVSTALLPPDLLLRTGLSTTSTSNSRCGRRVSPKIDESKASASDDTSQKSRETRNSARAPSGSHSTQNVIYPAASLMNAKASFICAVENRRKYLCRVCGKQFTQRGGLHIHMRIHLGQKPFVCETCGAAFSQACNLKRHCRSHTGERPHACLQCGKRFNRKWSLEKHYLTHLKSMRPGLVDIANTIASQQQASALIAGVSSGSASSSAPSEDKSVRPLPHVMQRLCSTEQKTAAVSSASALTSPTGTSGYPTSTVRSFASSQHTERKPSSQANHVTLDASVPTMQTSGLSNQYQQTDLRRNGTSQLFPSRAQSSSRSTAYHTEWDDDARRSGEGH